MAWYDGIVSTASDLAGAGAQIAKGVIDKGAWILKGAGTAITDPGKFVSDVGKNMSTWGEYIGRSAKSGADMIKEGWDDVKKGGNPGLLFVKAMGGMSQIASLGASAAIGDHLAETVVEATDELGNVSGYSTKEGTDALTRLGVKMFGGMAANAKNINNEIEEALDAGDAATANKVFGQAALAAGGKVVKVVGIGAGIAVGVAGAIPTGGASLAIPAVLGSAALGIGIAGGGAAIGNRMTEHGEVMFDQFNAEDDVADMRDDYVRAALEAGQITEDQAEEYGKIVETVYQNATYKAMQPDVIQQMGYADAKEMTSAMLQAYGYDTGNRAVVDMSSEAKADLYMEQFQQYVDDGTYTADQARAMANLQVSYEDGNMDLRSYSRAVAHVSVSETGMSSAERASYCDKVAGLVCGDYSPDEFQSLMAADPLIGKYVGEDGSVTFPAKSQGEQSRGTFLSGIGASITGARASLEGVTAGSAAEAKSEQQAVSGRQAEQAAENQARMSRILEAEAGGAEPSFA